MTPEELLKPRYKVIADYPLSPYHVNDLITMSDSGKSFHLTTTWYWEEGERRESDNYAPLSTLDTYPHLFHKLEWWQERKPEEMPEYVKTRYGSLEVKKVKGYVGCGKVIEFEENEEALALYWLPATLEEYNAYQSSIKDTTTTNKIK